MALWWIGNIVLLVIVIPVVLVILRSVIKPAISIKKHSDELVTVGSSIVTNLDAVYDLLETQRLVGLTGAGIGRYGAALDRIIPDPPTRG
jgi:uncharacterized protein YqgC (DUF456 family)